MPTPETAWTGEWWLPEHPQRRIRGTARFGTSKLEVSESFEPPTLPAPKDGVITVEGTFETRDYPVLFGEVDGVGPVTLAEVAGLHFNLPANQPWHFRYAIEGELVPAAELVFDHFSFSTDFLWSWATPPPISLHGEQDAPMLRLPGVELLDCSFGQARIHLGSRPTMHVDSPKANAELVAYWEIDLAAPASFFEGMNDWIGPLRDLVSLLSGRPNRLTWVDVRRDGWTTQRPVHMWLLGDDLPVSDGSLPRSEQLLPRVSVDDPCACLVRWLDQRDKLRQVHARLLSMGYMPFVFEEQRLTSLAQAAEQLHKKLWDRPSIAKQDHDQRVEASIAGAPEEHKSWARGVLKNANQLSLRTRIAEIVEHARVSGLPMGPADSGAFGKEISEGRNIPSHGGGLLSAAVDLEHLHRCFQGLDWMLKVLLLAQIGVDRSVVADRLAHNQDFLALATHLGWTLTMPSHTSPGAEADGPEARSEGDLTTEVASSE